MDPRMNLWRRAVAAASCWGIGLLMVGCWIGASHGQEWHQFRGPGAQGVGADPRLPLTWSSTENIAWKTDVPGRGWSSPIVLGDLVVVTTVVNRGESESPKKGLYFGGDRPEPPESEHEWRVIGLDLETGAVRWNTLVHTGQPQSSIHLKNSFASETPVSDGERIFAYFGNLGLYCLDQDGKIRWQRPFAAHKTRYGWGTAGSPVYHHGRVYVVDDNDEQSSLSAWDAETGNELWRVAREEKSNWSTPFVWEHALRTEIVTLGTDQVRSYDLEGNLLWTLTGMSSITIATPYVQDGLLIISSGYVLDPNRPMYAIRPGAVGDISLAEDTSSNEWIAWSQRQGAPYNPTTLGYQGRIFVLYDRGLFAAYRASDGTELFARQRIPNGGVYTATPWAYRDKVFCLNEDGVTHVFAAGDEFRWLYRNELAEDDMGMATPAIAGDRLLLRTSARIYCVRELAGAAPVEGDTSLFAEPQPRRLLATGAGEGPAWHPELGLFFSGDGDITRRDLAGTVNRFRERAGSNGLRLDAQGRLLACEPGQRRVTRTDLATGEVEILASEFAGKPFNTPNDLTIDAAGRIYFSDPKYGERVDLDQRDAEGRPIEGVYRIDPDGEVARIITHEVDRPNGVEIVANNLVENGHYLLVADNNNNTVGGARKLWRFDLREDGTIDPQSRHLLFDWQDGRGPDGMAVDQAGRLYVAAGRNDPVPPYEVGAPYGAGIYVLSPAGEQLAFVPIPHDEVTNCTFGGDDLRTLYITAGGTLWSIRTTTPGR